MLDEPKLNSAKHAPEQRERITGLLASKPLSAALWLSFAETQLATAQPAEKVVRAFFMSVLTGRHEGYVMVSRGVFGVSIWEMLPPESRRSTIADLSGTFVSLTDSEKDRLRQSLASKTVATRDEIRSALKMERLSDAAFARIGL
jgi:hypothetical protein